MAQQSSPNAYPEPGFSVGSDRRRRQQLGKARDYDRIGHAMPKMPDIKSRLQIRQEWTARRSLAPGHGVAIRLP
ncbi:MAG: hypothetical protein GVY22_08205 [Gammaproteobacteria bacterium]|jgi:hypothetical protein|nr:hypothetical protein [Gammaproteobacteria bacterium]